MNPGSTSSRAAATGTTDAITLGLRQNLAQFMLLVAVNALVGGTLGQERTVLPLLAGQVFHLDLYTSALTYILAFGVAKAATNYFAGTLSDRYGRKPVLVAGWLIALPVPLMLIFGPSWGWIVAANVVLGISQGLTWSTTVMMKMDLVGPERRGLAMGLNEAAGYLGVAGTALATGYIAATYGLRPGPFLLGAAFIAVGLGLSVSPSGKHTTMPGPRPPAMSRPTPEPHAQLSSREVFTLTSFRDKSLSSVSQAGHGQQPQRRPGLGPVPRPLRRRRADHRTHRHPRRRLPGRLGRRAAGHRRALGPDRRKPLIVGGMLVQAAALAMVAVGQGFGIWLAAAVLLGAGTAMVYPTLLAAIGDVAHPALAGPVSGDLPAMARRRLRRRRPALRNHRRCLRHSGRRRRRRRPDRGVRHCGGRADAQHGPPPRGLRCPRSRVPGLQDCFFRNASRACVDLRGVCPQHAVRGAVDLHIVGGGRALANRRPVASMGRMLSAVPCTIRAGTSILGMSARKSVSHVGWAAIEAVAPEAEAIFQLALHRFLAEPRGAQERIGVVEVLEEFP